MYLGTILRFDSRVCGQLYPMHNLAIVDALDDGHSKPDMVLDHLSFCGLFSVGRVLVILYLPEEFWVEPCTVLCIDFWIVCLALVLWYNVWYGFWSSIDLQLLHVVVLVYTVCIDTQTVDCVICISKNLILSLPFFSNCSSVFTLDFFVRSIRDHFSIHKVASIMKKPHKSFVHENDLL